MDSDVAYFAGRASEERTAALEAQLPEARKAHLELAERYEDLVRAIASRDRHLGLDLTVPEVAITQAAAPPAEPPLSDTART